MFARPDLAPINDVLDQAARAKMDSFAQEVALVRDGRERHVAAAATRIAGADGSFDGTVLVVDDVTPLIRAQKVAAWREVARRLAHEIKNPLTPIQLSAERLRRKLERRRAAAAGPRAGVHVDDHRRGRVAEGPGRRVLAVRAHAGAARGADRAARVPERHAGALRRAVRRRSSSQKHYDPAVTQVRLDPEQMKRVIINLIDNAIEAMGRAGHDRDRDRARRRPTAWCASSWPTPAPAFRPAERDKLFLPYYSTKGRGSGLGLAIVRRIVAEHGGSIDVTDNVPTGTRFIIELPCLMPSILVVDDEPGVRSSLSGVLRDEGFDVDTAGTGEECLEKANGAAYDVIVLDIWLPGLDGLTTLQRLRERQIDSQVVIISGHGNIESAVRAIKMGAFDFVEKPLSLEKTVLVVRNALRQRDLEAENRVLRAKVDRQQQHTMVGESPAMRHLREQVALAAPTNGRVLILGENGTGKELVARTIHQTQPAQERAVRRGQLRRDSRGADRVGAVRPRARRVHRRGGRQAGPLRAGQRRHDLPRRDRRHEPEDAGQGAARAAGAGDGARRRHAADQGRRARAGRDQQGPAGGDPRRPLPRRSLLPA